MYIDYLETPLGLLELMATDQGICQVIYCGDKSSSEQKIRSNVNAMTSQGKQELAEYFSGQRQKFTVPLDAQGTPFQQTVWHCLTQIPFGAVKAYGEIAKIINKPKASQAVGGANGRNPIAIIVPCHRVIGANGSLTGYAGGLERKLWLLNHEGNNMKQADKERQAINGIHERQANTQYLR